MFCAEMHTQSRVCPKTDDGLNACLWKNRKNDFCSACISQGTLCDECRQSYMFHSFEESTTRQVCCTCAQHMHDTASKNYTCCQMSVLASNPVHTLSTCATNLPKKVATYSDDNYTMGHFSQPAQTFRRQSAHRYVCHAIQPKTCLVLKLC